MTDILGLRSRVGRPLDFLGLYDTRHEACRRHHIPAIHISGDASEKQLLTAARVYINRPQLLEKVLNEIYNYSRDNEGFEPNQLLDAVLEAMERHYRKKMIQISGRWVNPVLLTYNSYYSCFGQVGTGRSEWRMLREAHVHRNVRTMQEFDEKPSRPWVKIRMIGT